MVFAEIRGEVLYGLSRYCTAERPPSAPRHIHCAQFDSEGLLNINDRVVTGCSEDCTEPNCNGTPLMKISQQMYRKFTEYRDHLNKTDPTILTVLDFPKIFATAEEQRRMEDAASVKATTPSMGVNLSSVPSVWLGLSSLTAALLMFWTVLTRIAKTSIILFRWRFVSTPVTFLFRVTVFVVSGYLYEATDDVSFISTTNTTREFTNTTREFTNTTREFR